MNAIESGRIAGKIARNAVLNNDASEKALHEYETAWNRSFGKSRTAMYKLRQILAQLTDNELSILLRSLAGKQLNGMNMRGIVKYVLVRNPRLLLSVGCRLL